MPTPHSFAVSRYQPLGRTSIPPHPFIHASHRIQATVHYRITHWKRPQQHVVFFRTQPSTKPNRGARSPYNASFVSCLPKCSISMHIRVRGKSAGRKFFHRHNNRRRMPQEYKTTDIGEEKCTIPFFRFAAMSRPHCRAVSEAGRKKATDYHTYCATMISFRFASCCWCCYCTIIIIWS